MITRTPYWCGKSLDMNILIKQVKHLKENYLTSRLVLLNIIFRIEITVIDNAVIEIIVMVNTVIEITDMVITEIEFTVIGITVMEITVKGIIAIEIKSIEIEGIEITVTSKYHRNRDGSSNRYHSVGVDHLKARSDLRKTQ